ncbi:DUF4335 domain-containing protein [Thermostichus vulcanus]|uniref:DUF4335 domain-containing protein n=1 Tax=Thermostichus vulcanus str. 'Rupite' TaxID=2813851 RepID=A0ABT0C6V9_THEVL|nr:DUF4335 domain-containing protein [Thermostichus vulcanus]MCJ2541424.1 DUF4335 domain-containing protein [Thermostichus vulcanus str. 'Rupite']
MPSISHAYQQPTSTLTVQGETAALPDAPEKGTAPPVQAIQRGFECQLEIRQGEARKMLRGDSVWLNDLITVINRYVESQLRGEPKGTFSGTVAIRPLDFIFHRLTVRQGEEGIAQVDLSMTQLYDLLENLTQVATDIPHLSSLKTQPVRAWYRQPTGIAALVVGGIAVVAGVGVLATRTPEAENQTANRVQEQLTTPTSLESAETAGQETAPADSRTLSADREADVDDLDLLSRLREQLADQWQSPPDLQESLVYRVTVDATGSLLAAEPANELAQERLGQTPLADLPDLPPDPLPTGAEQFRVSLDPDNQLEVTQD